MIQLLTILFCLAALVVEFFSVFWGWVILALPAVFLLITFFGVRGKKWEYIPELSDDANRMLQKFGHYYAMPFAGKDFSASASTVQFAAVAIGLIGVFKGFWWGIAIVAINWFLMAFLSRAFNPSNFLVDQNEYFAHDEIISYMVERQKSRQND